MSPGAPAGTELGFVRELGERRAQDIFPLEALMLGLRVGQQVLWNAMVAEAGPGAEGHAAAVAPTACPIDYTEAVSCELERSYAERQQLLARTGELAQREFFEATLSGRLFAHDDAAGRAATAGFVLDADYVVAAVALRAELADRTGLDLLRAALERRAWADGRPPFVVRGEHVIVVVATRRVSQVTEMVRCAASTIGRGGTDQVVAGVGGPCRGLSEVPRGCEWALLALRHAHGVGGVVVLDDVGVFDYLLSSADPTARRLSGRRADALLAEDERQGGMLTQTFAAYIDCDLNVVRTAKVLGLHANTIRHRLAKIEGLTGLDTRRVPDVIELAASVGLCRPRAGGGWGTAL
jgi:DNA-binding PucR family transcriptional regulator